MGDGGEEVAMKMSMGKIRGEVASNSSSSSEHAQKKHALSERKRRNRINSHYQSLRHLFPRLLKSDKASVLAETVRHLKQLKKSVAEHIKVGEPSCFIPGDKDETTVTYVNNTTLRATVCCEDRPGLNHDLTQALHHSVRGCKAVKAKMATIGGRTKMEVVVAVECGSSSGDIVQLLTRALKAVVENRVLSPTFDHHHGSTSTTREAPPGFGLGLGQGL